MGEWSEYFEDFPDENPANYVGERFDPKRAAEVRHAQSASPQAVNLRLALARLGADARFRAAHTAPAPQAPTVRKPGR